MTIYLDAIWLLNLLFDFLLLLVTKNLMKDRTHIMRILLGSFIASLIVPLAILKPDTLLLTSIGKILFSMIIVISSFRWHSVKRFLSLWIMFYFVTFTIGGSLSAVHQIFSKPFFMKSHGLLTFDTGYGDPISWLFVLIGFPIALYFMQFRMNEFSISKIRFEQLYDIEVKLFNETYKTRALLDSGNELVDPLTKEPVIILDEKFLKNWFSTREWQEVENVMNSLNVNDLDSKLQKIIRLVPFSTVGQDNHFLLAAKPEKLIIHYGNEKIITNRVLIGFKRGVLHEQGDYHCLLNASLISLNLSSTA